MTKRNTMDKFWRKELLIGATAMMLLLAGCQSSKPINQNSNNDLVVVAEEITSDGPQKSYLEDNHKEASGSESPSENTEDIDDGSSAETSSVRQDEENTAPDSGSDNESDWNKKLPSLHGIAIGDETSAVTSRLGREMDSYLLEETSGQIHVHEYPGVSIGFNGKGAVHFIEVFGSETSGFNGLKIGDKPEQALKQLGKPETQSEYVMNYEGDGARLKLDIDPGVNEIVSMKLIAAN
jgi:hypothetical protein